MITFEELGLSPELVEALAAEGIEIPTGLQEATLPVLRKGHSALVRGGPGAGSLVAWSAPLLDRLDPVPGGPVLVAMVPTDAMALALARSLARLGAATGHRVAALGGPFALPGHADVLLATPGALAMAIRNSEVVLGGTQAVVLVGAGALLSDEGGRNTVGGVLEALENPEIQRVVVSEPVTAEVRAFVDAELSRAVFLPTDAGKVGEVAEAPVQRGTLRLRAVEGDEDLALAQLAGELLEGDARHLLLFFRSEDRAADAGDLLTLHGFLAAEPGEASAPVWLATDGMTARRALEGVEAVGAVVAISVDAPPDADELDRRHGGGHSQGVILARAREAAHLRRIAQEAGYSLVPFPAPRSAAADPGAALVESLGAVIEGEDLEPYHLLLEKAAARWGAHEVAAALALLLRRKGRLDTTRGRLDAPHVEAAPGAPAASSGEEGAPVAFVRLFLSVGSRDGVGPGELLGAITGEAEIRGDQVGRIDIRDTFSRVEVDEGAAARVIKALNGTSIRGRSVRADYDRAPVRSPGGESRGPGGGSRRPGGDRPGGDRSGGGRPGGGGGRGPRTGGPGGGGGGPRRRD
jgi:ATP-dependent RNA helicase DeaD